VHGAVPSAGEKHVRVGRVIDAGKHAVVVTVHTIATAAEINTHAQWRNKVAVGLRASIPRLSRPRSAAPQPQHLASWSTSFGLILSYSLSYS